MDTSGGWSGPERSETAPVGTADTFGSVDHTVSSVTRARGADLEHAPFHYRTESETTLGELVAAAPSLRHLRDVPPRVPVIFIRATARSGVAVRIPPRATRGAIFLDHSDLATLRAGMAVASLEDAISSLIAVRLPG